MTLSKYAVLGLILLSVPLISLAATKNDIPTPDQLTSKLTSNKLVLSWRSPDYPRIKGYNVYVKGPGSEDFTLITQHPITITAVHLKNLAMDKDYEFAVATIDTNGNQSPLARLKVVTKALTFSTPSGFQAKALDKGIQLTWDKTDPSLVSGFNLYLADKAGYPEKKLSPEPIRDNWVNLSKLKRDKPYRFILTALSPAGQESTPTQVLEVQYPNRLPAGPPGPWFFEFAGGVDFPEKNWQPAYKWTNGGMVSLGLALDKHLSVLLDVEGFYFSGSTVFGSISDTEIRALPTLHYNFGEKGVRPYLLAGGGLDLELISAPAGSLTNADLDAALGAGIEIPLTKQAFFFAEGRYNLIFFSGVTGQDLPLFAGVRFGS